LWGMDKKTTKEENPHLNKKQKEEAIWKDGEPKEKGAWFYCQKTDPTKGKKK